jgi:hypothetical protein
MSVLLGKPLHVAMTPTLEAAMKMKRSKDDPYLSFQGTMGGVDSAHAWRDSSGTFMTLR